jgi:hypothetical protein
METKFEPNPKRIKRTTEETKAQYEGSGGYVVYDPDVCDPEEYPVLEKKKFPELEPWDTGLDPEGDADYYYAVYDAIQKVDAAIVLLDEAQDCIANWDVRDGRWEESYNNLTQMRNDWVDEYTTMRNRAIKSKKAGVSKSD